MMERANRADFLGADMFYLLINIVENCLSRAFAVIIDRTWGNNGSL